MVYYCPKHKTSWVGNYCLDCKEEENFLESARTQAPTSADKSDLRPKKN